MAGRVLNGWCVDVRQLGCTRGANWGGVRCAWDWAIGIATNDCREECDPFSIAGAARGKATAKVVMGDGQWWLRESDRTGVRLFGGQEEVVVII